MSKKVNLNLFQEIKLPILLILIGTAFSILFSSHTQPSAFIAAKYIFLPIIFSSLVIYILHKIPNQFQKIFLSVVVGMIFLTTFIKKTDFTISLTIMGSFLIFIALSMLQNKKITNQVDKIIKYFILIITAIYLLLFPIKYLIDPQNQNTNTKIQNISTSFHLAAVFPVSGIGLDNFQEKYSQKVSQIFPKSTNITQSFPNNFFLSIWLYFGLFGLFGFMWLLIIALTHKISPALISLTLILFIGQWHNVYFVIQSCFLIWIYLAIHLYESKKH